MFASVWRARSAGGASQRRQAFHAALVLAVILVGLVYGCFGPPMRTGSDARTTRIVSHEVAPGESLETIADDYYGDEAAADYLRGVNDIGTGESVQEGSVLDVPVGDEDISRYERRTEAKVHYNRGTLLADRGDLERASDEFREALRIDPRFADAGHNLGVVLLRAGEAERAVAVLRQTARLRPDDPDLLYALGAALLEAGHDQKALEVFEETVELAPLNEDARFSRALALDRLGRVAEAVFQLDLYLREFPNGRWSQAARAMLEDIGSRGDEPEALPETVSPDGRETPEPSGDVSGETGDR